MSITLEGQLDIFDALKQEQTGALARLPDTIYNEIRSTINMSGLVQKKVSCPQSEEDIQNIPLQIIEHLTRNILSDIYRAGLKIVPQDDPMDMAHHFEVLNGPHWASESSAWWQEIYWLTQPLAIQEAFHQTLDWNSDAWFKARDAASAKASERLRKIFEQWKEAQEK